MEALQNKIKELNLEVEELKAALRYTDALRNKNAMLNFEIKYIKAELRDSKLENDRLNNALRDARLENEALKLH